MRPSAFLSRIGRAVFRRAHGSEVGPHGFAVVRGRYVLPGQELSLGWCYLGMLGVPVFIACVWYVAFKYGEPVGPGGLPRARFASWAIMPAEVRLALVTALVSWAIGFGSILRLVFLGREISDQPTSHLE